MHEINALDRQDGVSVAWHKLTNIIPDLNLDNNWLTEWDVTPRQLEIAGKPIPWWMLECDDNQHLIGKPFKKESYFPINNARFLDIIRQSISGTSHKVVSVGSVCNRGRIFVSIELQGMEKFKAAGRVFEQYLNFGSSHDQSCVFYINTSNVCQVCFNTVSFNLNYQGKMVNARVKHNSKAESKLENLPEIIDASVGVQAEFAMELEKLANKPIKAARAERIYAGFIGKNSEEKLSSRSMDSVNRLVTLFESGRGNKGENFADLFQSTTEFFTHESSNREGKNNWKQFVSSEFGIANLRKSEFWSIIQDDNNLNKTEKHGEILLLNS